MECNSTDAFRSHAAIVRFVVTVAIGLGLDLWTKSQTVAHIALGDGIDVIPGWLRLEFTMNRGAVFGIAQGQRWVFMIVSAAAIIFLTYLFSTSARRAFYQIILGMLLAGVLGNMYDRVRYGYVRDMIHAFPGSHWAAWVQSIIPSLHGEIFPWIFNVADSLLCVGVGLMLIYSFVQSPKPEVQASEKVSS